MGGTSGGEYFGSFFVIRDIEGFSLYVGLNSCSICEGKGVEEGAI